MNINRVVLTGNLTRDPELKALPSGLSVCNLGLAVNNRKKEGNEWVNKPSFFNVTVWGKQAENAAQYLSKGRAVAIDGRLEQRQWVDKAGEKRSTVDIIAQEVQFIGGQEVLQGEVVPETQAAATTASDDDIPF